MPDARDDGGFARSWTAHRTHLVDLAFRMLGDLGEAEEVVQEAFSRLSQADLAAIEDDRGWLTVVTSRLCLDRIRSARSRRERLHDLGDGRPVEELVVSSPDSDPADRVTLDDSVRLALLVVMQRLSPAERVAFVLHDIFRLPFDAVAETVGRTPASCRQLARRARQKVEAETDGRRFDISAAEHRQVTERFIAACATGDMGGLLEVLDADVAGEVDRGLDLIAPGPVRGADRVGANLLRFWAGATMVTLPLDGQPAVLAFQDGQLAGVLVLTMRPDAERIAKVHVIADPSKVAFLRAQLALVAGRAPGVSG
jgi:RNA polymerase sigma-70 factor (ECF subfamily)